MTSPSAQTPKVSSKRETSQTTVDDQEDLQLVLSYLKEPHLYYSGVEAVKAAIRLHYQWRFVKIKGVND